MIVNRSSRRVLVLVVTLLFIGTPIASSVFVGETVAQPQPQNTVNDASVLSSQPWAVCDFPTSSAVARSMSEGTVGVIQGSTLGQTTLVPLGVAQMAWDAFKGIIRESVREFREGVGNLLKELSALFIAVPAPGNPSEPTTWTPWEMTEPEMGKGPDGRMVVVDEPERVEGKFEKDDDYKGDVDFLETHVWWNAVWGIYTGFSGLATVCLATLAVFHHSNRTSVLGNPINHQERTRKAVQAFILVALGWIIISLYLHGMNTISTGIAPDLLDPNSGKSIMDLASGEISSDNIENEDIEKIGVGFLLGAILLIVDYTVLLVAILALLAQWVLMMFVVGMFPIAMVARVSGSNYAQVVSDTVFSLLIGLPMLKILQVTILRFVFEIYNESALAGAGATQAIALIVLIVGIFISSIYVPVEGTKRLLPDAMIASGGMGGSGGKSSKSKAQAVSAQSTQVKTQVRDGHSSARRSLPSGGRGRSSGSSSGGSHTHTSTTTTSSSSRSAPSGSGGSAGRTSPGTSAEASSSRQTSGGSQPTNSEMEVTTTVRTQNQAETTGTSSGSARGSGRRYPRHTPQYFLQQMKRTVDKRRRSN